MPRHLITEQALCDLLEYFDPESGVAPDGELAERCRNHLHLILARADEKIQFERMRTATNAEELNDAQEKYQQARNDRLMLSNLLA